MIFYKKKFLVFLLHFTTMLCRSTRLTLKVVQKEHIKKEIGNSSAIN
jgi:hypothetical protein